MCGILFGVVAVERARAEEEQALALASPEWHWEPYETIQTALWPRWEVFRANFPDEVFYRPTARSEMRAAIQTWWTGEAQPLWESEEYQPFRRAWERLGWLLYGRIVYEPHSGSGWLQTRPRRQLFPSRLHPIGTIQWGTLTTAESQLAPPLAIIEQAPAPATLCCCHLGDSFDDAIAAEKLALLVTVMDSWSSIVSTMDPTKWLVIESDTDFNEV